MEFPRFNKKCWTVRLLTRSYNYFGGL